MRETFLRFIEKYFLIGAEKRLSQNIVGAEHRKNEINFPAANLMHSVQL